MVLQPVLDDLIHDVPWYLIEWHLGVKIFLVRLKEFLDCGRLVRFGSLCFRLFLGDRFLFACNLVLWFILGDRSFFWNDRIGSHFIFMLTVSAGDDWLRFLNAEIL